ncbi:MAG: diguanylate cyclase [Syntrophus sp. (in: bacteria)]
MSRQETEITAKITRGYDSAGLRKQAEEIARRKAALIPENLEGISSEETQQILHELRVHQIELEIQNEELRRTQTELAASRSRYFDLYDLAPIGYVTVSEKGLILEANLTAANLLGTVRSTLVKQPFSRFILSEDQGIYYSHDKKLIEAQSTSADQAGEPHSYRLRMIKMDGTAFWARLETTAAQDTAGRSVYRIVLSDISDRKHLEEELREMSLHDVLTGLHNRRGFFALAEHQVKAAARARMKLSLTYFDCDDFKWINDSLGHEQGDKVLVDTAHILRQTFRGSDIVARIGGDEFVVLSRKAADSDHEVFLKRLQQNIDGYNAKENRRYKLALSWGTIAYDPESPESLDDLLSQADRLMYMHKREKSNN